jgi:hypothetical protein
MARSLSAITGDEGPGVVQPLKVNAPAASSANKPVTYVDGDFIAVASLIDDMRERFGHADAAGPPSALPAVALRASPPPKLDV